MVRILRQEKVLLLLVLLALVLTLFAPIYYDFDYPARGPDAAGRVIELDRITLDLGKVASLWYYSPLLLLPFTKLGASPITVYIVFTYLVVIGTLLSVYFLVRRYYGKTPAILAFLGMLLVGFGFLYHFRGGTIYHLFTLYIMVPGLVYSVTRYLKGNDKWLIPSILLVVLISLAHPIGYVYTGIALMLFLVGYWLYYRGENSKPIPLAVATMLTIPIAWYTWGVNAMMPYIEYTGGVVKITPVIEDPLLPTLYFLAIPLLITLCGGYLILRNREVREKLNQPITYLLLAYLLTATALLIGTGKERLMLDLSVFLTITGAIIIGVYLSTATSKGLLRFTVRVGLVAVVIVAIPISIFNWTVDYTVLRPVDKEVIEFLNEQDRGLEVLYTPQISPQIYRLYTDDIRYEEIDEGSNPDEYDYILYRDRFSRTGHYGQRTPKFDLSLIDGLDVVEVFEAEGITIKVFEVQ